MGKLLFHVFFFFFRAKTQEKLGGNTNACGPTIGTSIANYSQPSACELNHYDLYFLHQDGIFLLIVYLYICVHKCVPWNLVTWNSQLCSHIKTDNVTVNEVTYAY